MKKIKKLASLFLAALMMLTMAIPTFAAGVAPEVTDHDNVKKDTKAFTLTIKAHENGDPVGYEYKAYQIFKGDLVTKDKTSILSNIEWGDDVVQNDAFKTAFPDDAKKVAESLDSKSFDDTAAKEFAAKIAPFLNKNGGNDLSPNSTEAPVMSYSSGNLAPGYYLVQNENVPDGQSYTRYMLEVVGNVTATPKSDTVTSDKDIVDDETVTNDVDNIVKVNEAPIGKVVDFRAWAKLPENYADYKEYYLAFKDYLTKGFTLTTNEDGTPAVRVYVATGTTVKNTKGEDILTFEKVGEITSVFSASAAPVDHTVGGVTETTTGLTVSTANLKKANTPINAGQYIVLEYSATVNENAVIGIAGNPNYVKVEFSNDPNNSGDGTTEPGDEPKGPHGETPESETNTYLAELVIRKVNQDNVILPGAGFTLNGNGVHVTLATVERFEIATDGEYWKLTDGTFTKEEPTAETSDKYDGDAKYAKVVKLETADQSVEWKIEGIVDASGDLKFTGLGEGEYTLEETTVPAGYNKCENITFKIEFNRDKNVPKFQMKDAQYVPSGKTIEVVDKEGAGFEFSTTIQNNRGSLLPSTGGIGTTIFYIVGGVLIVGAGILLVAKKRMSAK